MARKLSALRSPTLPVLGLLFLTTAAPNLFAQPFLAFGPETFVRQAGQPADLTRTFTVDSANLNRIFILRLDNGGLKGDLSKVEDAVVTLNGVVVAASDSFDDKTTVLQKVVPVQGTNKLAIHLSSDPGSGFALQILGVRTFDGYAPEDFVRATGAPVTVTRTFSIANPNTTWILRVFNGGVKGQYPRVSSAVITLNGKQILEPDDFGGSPGEDDGGGKPAVTYALVPVSPTNQLTVELRSKPGSGLTIELLGVDNDPPTITGVVTPTPNTAGWNKSNATVTFTCADAISGVFSCTAPVQVSTEGANQVVIGTAQDKAGNTASVSVNVSLDKTAPVLTITSPTNNQAVTPGSVTVTGTATDALSGIATVMCGSAAATITGSNFTCTYTVVPGPNTLTVQAVDKAGNTTQSTVSVQGGNATILTVNAATGQQGQNLQVAITGQGTHWVQGTTTASFGAGVTVVTLTISSATSATAVLAIDAAAATGARTVSLNTGTETASLANGFTITAAPPLKLVTVADRTIQLGTTLSLRLSASDPDPVAALTYIVDSAPTGAALNPSPVLTWTPTAAQLGKSSFAVHVQDNHGKSDAATFNVTVVNSTQPPTLSAQANQVIPAGSLFQRTLLAQTPNPGDTLTFALLSGPAGMTLSGSMLNWTPGPAQLGTNQVKVKVTNSSGQSDAGDFFLTVTSVLAPIAQNDRYSIALGGLLNIAAPGVLSNDISPNNTPLTAAKTSNPDKGLLTAFGADGSFSFAPPTALPAPAFQPVLKFEAAPSLTAYKPALIVDLNKDGKPDLFVPMYAAGTDTRFYAFNGIDGSVLWQAPLTSIPGSTLPIFPGTTCTPQAGYGVWQGSPAAADLDGDGYPEIVFPVSCGQDSPDGLPAAVGQVERYIALSGRDGTVKWLSDVLGTRTYASRPDLDYPDAANNTSATIAVLQAGQTPSVVIAGASRVTCDSIVTGASSNQRCRYVVVLDGATGHIRTKMYSTASTLATTIEAIYNPLRHAPAIVFDLRGDGKLEIVAGGTVFDAQTGTVLWEDTNAISTTAIANLDGQPDVEVIMVDNTRQDNITAVKAYKANGQLLWSVPTPSTTVWGNPTVADVNRDGFPEVMITVFNQLWVISHDGQLLWTSSIPSGDNVDEGFRATAYDLDNTGIPKVLLQSRQNLYFLDGVYGSIFSSIPVPNTPSTFPSWPTFADLGGDGHAKVEFQGAPNTAGGSGGGAFVYQAQNNDWRPVRNIRSQFSDYGGNINDDGTVPFPQPNVFADPRTNVFGSPAPAPYASGFTGASQTHFTYTASASGLQSAPATVTIDLVPQNRPPQFTSVAPTRFDINAGFSYQAVAVDPDLGDTVTYSLTLNDPGACNIDAVTGLMTCGQYGVPYRHIIVAATDNHGASSYQVINMASSTPGAVPNVVGLTQSAANALITGSGYTVGSSKLIYSAQAAGTVLSQAPSAGSSVLLGEVIQVTVSKGPAPVVVPDVTTRTQGQANSILTAAGFTPAPTLVFSNNVPEGQVISQNPAAGTLITPGTEAITVSAGTGLYLKLSGAITPADTPLPFTVTAYDLSGNQTAAPPLNYNIVALITPFAGPLPTISGGNIVPGSSTRGAFRLTATDPATNRAVTADFAVSFPHQPGVPTMTDDYLSMTQGMSDINDLLRQGKAALAANNTALVKSLVSQIVQRWRQVNIDDLSYDMPMGLDHGFFPTADQLGTLGLTPTPDDLAIADVLKDADIKLNAWIDGLNAPNTSMADLATLADQFNTAAARLNGLSPSLWGVINSQSTLTVLLSHDLPLLYEAVINQLAQTAGLPAVRLQAQSPVAGLLAFNAEALDAPARTRSGPQPRSTLAEVLATTALQFAIDKIADYAAPQYSNAKKFATDIMMMAGWSAIAVELTSAVRSGLGETGSQFDATTVAGASLSFHEFNSPYSLIDCICPMDYPKNAKVYIIGPSITNPVSSIYSAIKSGAGVGSNAGTYTNLNQIVKDVKTLRNTITTLQNSVGSVANAIANAQQQPSQVSSSCLFLQAPCGELIYPNGFSSVYQYTPPPGFGSFVGLPVPIILMVYDSVSGRMFFDRPEFFPTPAQ